MGLRTARFAAVVALAVLAATSCQRRTSFVVIQGDSTAIVPEDSVAAEMRKTQQAWESGGDLDDAAMSSARVLQADLAFHDPAGWDNRANYVLDSLGVGAEIGSASCVLLVNFFSRSDPEAGAWPYLFWCGTDHTMMQALEGRSLRLHSIWASTSPTSGKRARTLAAIFSRRGSGGQQPLVMTWTTPPSGSRWNLVQTLGADSLGGYGTAELVMPSDTSVELSVEAYRTPSGFVECATCPHVLTRNRFHETTQGFVRTESSPEPSPYASFVAFIQALLAGDQATAAQHLDDPALMAEAERLEWNHAKGTWRPAPGSGDTPQQMTFFRGSQEAYSVQFRRRGGDWLISGFTAVPRNVE